MSKKDEMLDSEIEKNKEISKTLRIDRRMPYYKAVVVVIIILVVIVAIWYLIK